MTNPRNRSHPAAFTLMELVVVLAILAVVTSLAVRSVDRVEDQGRYEANLRIMQEIETAVLGSPDDRALDGTRVLSGFVADMGRLPRTVEETVLISGIEAKVLTLRELWERPASVAPYDVTQAEVENLAADDASHADVNVYVPGGWRGPYLRLPMEETALRDGWGNFIRSLSSSNPPALLAAEYGRLRDINEAPITVQGQEVFIIRHLGADGLPNISGTVGLDQDGQVDFRGREETRIQDPVRAAVKATVDVVKADGSPPSYIGTERVIVRVFGPSVDEEAKIDVAPSEYISVSTILVDHDANLDTPSIPGGPLPPASIEGLTIGHRVVRAYLENTDGTRLAASAVKNVVLQPGVNSIHLTIYR